MKIVSEILNTLVGKEIVEVSPAVGLLDVLRGAEGLKNLDDLNVGDNNGSLVSTDLNGSGDGRIVLDNDASFSHKISVNRNTILLGNKHSDIFNKEVIKSLSAKPKELE